MKTTCSSSQSIWKKEDQCAQLNYGQISREKTSVHLRIKILLHILAFYQRIPLKQVSKLIAIAIHQNSKQLKQIF